jgi:hypothetical protein
MLCTERGCPILQRDCREFTITVTDVSDWEDPVLVQMLAIEALEMGGPITEDAPDGLVVVRAVVTAEPCEVIDPPDRTPRYACDSLVGCLVSSPMALDTASSLVLDLPGDTCTVTELSLCAGFGPGVEPICPM